MNKAIQIPEKATVHDIAKIMAVALDVPAVIVLIVARDQPQVEAGVVISLQSGGELEEVLAQSLSGIANTIRESAEKRYGK